MKVELEYHKVHKVQFEFNVDMNELRDLDVTLIELSEYAVEAALLEGLDEQRFEVYLVPDEFPLFMTGKEVRALPITTTVIPIATAFVVEAHQKIVEHPFDSGWEQF